MMWMQEMERWVIERPRGSEAITVAHLGEALEAMPNGFGVMSIQNRDDGTTIVVLQHTRKHEKRVP